MLTHEDEPTIRNAFMKRLERERGVKICEIKVVPHLKETPPFIAVGVLATLDDAVVTRSLFHLPALWALRHLHNEIDEICEQMKAARKLHFGRGGAPLKAPESQLLGTGLRGRWRQHA
jgi:hypothetical protein